MRNILALFAVIILASCAASTDTLIAEANNCIATSINESGIVGQPSDEQGDLCWAAVNRRMDAEERREKDRKLQAQCPNGRVAWCAARFADDRCSCVSRQSVREALGGTAMAW